MSITVFHNPRCSKSRQVLKILEEKGIASKIVLYLETPPNTDQLKSILDKLNITPRKLIRKNEQEYKDHNLGDLSLTEDQLIRFMCKYPKLIERPIVINGERAAIGRPPESILEII